MEELGEINGIVLELSSSEGAKIPFDFLRIMIY
jgi:hypothetical protein